MDSLNHARTGIPIMSDERDPGHWELVLSFKPLHDPKSHARWLRDCWRSRILGEPVVSAFDFSISTDRPCYL